MILLLLLASAALALALVVPLPAARVILCPPPVGDGRAFFFLVEGPLGAGALPPTATRGLLLLSDQPDEFYDKTCGFPFHAECESPWVPGNEVLHNDTPLGLGYFVQRAQVNTYLGLVYPEWGSFPGDADAQTLMLNLYELDELYGEGVAILPTPYNPPGLTLEQAQSLRYANLGSAPTDRALPLNEKCYFLFPGAKTSIYPTAGGGPGLATSNVRFPGQRDSQCVCTTPGPLVTPKPAPGALSPLAQYSPNLYYPLGAMVSVEAALPDGTFTGPFYQVKNRLSYSDSALGYAKGSTVQFLNTVFLASEDIPAGVLPNDPTSAWQQYSLPGPPSPATSPFFSVANIEDLGLTLFLPNVEDEPLPSATAPPLPPPQTPCGNPWNDNACLGFSGVGGWGPFGVPPPSIANNPMLFPGTFSWDPEQVYFPGLAPPVGLVPPELTLAPNDATAAQAFPLPATNLAPVTAYSVDLAYPLGSVVSVTPALQDGTFAGPFFQVVNQAPWDVTIAYAAGALVQYQNVLVSQVPLRGKC
jgi:hypothetical protein